MKRILRHIMVSLLAVAAVASAPSAIYAKGWETLKTEKAGSQKIASDTEVEIKAGNGMIYVTATKSVNIQIFTILGSRIADDTLAAGSYQFAVPSHGVFIVKAGTLTCKVAL